MKFIDYALKAGYDNQWLDHNTDGLFDRNAEMVRFPERDNKSDAYMIDGCCYHVSHGSSDVVEIFGANGDVIEEYILD